MRGNELKHILLELKMFKYFGCFCFGWVLLFTVYVCKMSQLPKTHNKASRLTLGFDCIFLDCVGLKYWIIYVHIQGNRQCLLHRFGPAAKMSSYDWTVAATCALRSKTVGYT